jgi:hypothetical protein
MTRRAACAAALAAAIGGAPAAAQDLTAEGATLPSVVLAPDAPASYAVDLGGDAPDSAHVLLRAMGSGRVLARDRDGFWAPWDGDPAALPPSAAVRDGDRLTYKLFLAAPLAQLSPPYMVTLAYRSGGVLKYGAFMASIAAPESAPEPVPEPSQ